MILSQALLSSAQFLFLEGVEDSHLESRIFVQNIMNLRPPQLFSEHNRIMQKEEVEKLWNFVLRRVNNEPTAYLVGHKEFCGFDFYVDSRVLIPRPETELIIENALQWISTTRKVSLFKERRLLIADIGTGCGAIAITLALKSTKSIVYAIDISKKALQVAQINCHKHRVNKAVKLLQGNLLEPIKEPLDLMVANLPYLTRLEFEKLSPDIKHHEPFEAIFGGEDGMSVIEGLLNQLQGKIFPHTALFLEIGMGQDTMLVSLLKDNIPGAQCSFTPDYNGINRIAKITFTHI